jgi:pyochelin biosynthetic protein PchC
MTRARQNVWLRGEPRPAARVSLVCFPHAGGSASFFQPWRPLLPAHIEPWIVEYPGRHDRIGDACITDVHTLADRIVEAASPWRVQAKPLVLFGHSFGASVAYEVACRLRSKAGAVLELFASGARAPAVWNLGVKPRAHDDAALWNEVVRLGGTAAALLEKPELRELVLPALRADYHASERYRANPGPKLRCDVTAFVGDQDPDVDLTDAQAWQETTEGSFRLKQFSGDHFYLISQRAALIEELVCCLNRRLLANALPCTP